MATTDPNELINGIDPVTYWNTPSGGGGGDPSMPNNQAQSGTIGNGQPGDTSGSGPQQNDPNTPNINTSRDANGNLVFSGQGSGGGGYGSTPAPAGGQNYAANYGSGNAYGSPGQVAANNAGGGGGGGMGGGSSGSVGGGYAPGQGLQNYPASSNPNTGSSPSLFDPSNNSMFGGGSTGQMAGTTGKTSGNQPLGSTTQGTPSYGQTGGGFNPNSNAYTIAQPYGGGPQTMMGQAGFQGGGAGSPSSQYGSTGFQGGGAGTPSSQYGNTGFKQAGPMDQSMTNQYQQQMQNPMQGLQTAQQSNNPYQSGAGQAMGATGFQGGGAGQLNPSMLNQYQGMMQNPLGGLQTAQNSSNPYQGGPQNYLTMSGFNGQQAGLNPSLSTAGFQQGGIGSAPQTSNQQYQNMLSNPTDMTANPAYKAIMDAATQATERTGLARGGNGGGTLQAELAKTGASVAGQYLPQMANMYQGGAQQETANWGAQNQANLQAGNLGGNLYGSQNQANLGYGNLGGSLYGTSGNQALGFGNQALTGYGQGVTQLGQGAQQQTQNYQAQNQANLGYGQLGSNVYGQEAGNALGMGNQALQGYNTGVQNLGQGAQQQGTNYGLQSQANLGYGNMANNAYSAQNQANLGYGTMANNGYGLQNQANLGYGNLGNNAWQGAANNQFNLGSAYSNLASNAQNTQTAAMAQAQMQPSNAYFQNQLTMSGMGG